MFVHFLRHHNSGSSGPDPEPDIASVWRRTKRSNLRARFSPRKYWLVSLGISLSSLGLALSASALAVMYAEGARVVEAASSTSAWQGGADAPAPEPKLLTQAARPGSLYPQGAPPVAAPVPSGSPWPGQSSRAAESTAVAESVRLQAFGLSPVATPVPASPAAPAERVAGPEPASAQSPRPPAAIVEAPASGYVLRRIANVNLTFYDCLNQGFCGNMANGNRVYEGAAACSYDLPLGTRFYIIGDPTGRIYRCDDRGLLSNTWVDIFWHHPSDGWRWQLAVGRYGTIDVIEWGQ